MRWVRRVRTIERRSAGAGRGERDATTTFERDERRKQTGRMPRLDGTLSAEEFAKGVCDLLSDSSAIACGRWVDESRQMVRATTASGYGELASEARGEALELESASVDEEAFDEEFDDAVALSTTRGHVREYRIVYSPSFRVPVLCVRARDAKTREKWSATRLLQSLWRENPCVQTNEGDPVLTPYSNPHERDEGDWACVHPCSTAEVMRLLLADEGETPSPRRYIDIWLRYVAREICLVLRES